MSFPFSNTSHGFYRRAHMQKSLHLSDGHPIIHCGKHLNVLRWKYHESEKQMAIVELKNGGEIIRQTYWGF